MAYLDLSPAIAALRARPEEFELSNDALYHPSSRHRFRFPDEDTVDIHADCDCSTLRATQQQARVFRAAYLEWHACYWRPLEINREFASHFESRLWRRAAIWLLRRLLAVPRMAKPAPGRTEVALLMWHH